MTKPTLRAVVLCAGEGRRLRPLTSLLPKPLLPVAGRSVLEHTLARLATLGCDRVAVNLHHLGERIRQRLGDTWQGMTIAYSAERELLGTLGALGPLRDHLAGADLALVVNGDSLCRWPLKRLVRRHLKSGADATLLVSRRAPPATFGGGILIGERGRVLALRGGRAAAKGESRRVFAGAHVFAPALLERATTPLAGERADVVADLWEPLLAAGGRLAAVETRRPWHDLGTPGRYLAAVLETLGRRRFVAGGVQLERGARVRRAALEAGARIAAGARVEHSIVFPGAAVPAGGEVAWSIVGPEVALPAGAAVTARLVTAARSDLDVPAASSVLSGLVYTRLEPGA